MGVRVSAQHPCFSNESPQALYETQKEKKQEKQQSVLACAGVLKATKQNESQKRHRNLGFEVGGRGYLRGRKSGVISGR